MSHVLSIKSSSIFGFIFKQKNLIGNEKNSAWTVHQRSGISTDVCSFQLAVLIFQSICLNLSKIKVQGSISCKQPHTNLTRLKPCFSELVWWNLWIFDVNNWLFFTGIGAPKNSENINSSLCVPLENLKINIYLLFRLPV